MQQTPASSPRCAQADNIIQTWWWGLWITIIIIIINCISSPFPLVCPNCWADQVHKCSQIGASGHMVYHTIVYIWCMHHANVWTYGACMYNINVMFVNWRGWRSGATWETDARCDVQLSTLILSQQTNQYKLICMQYFWAEWCDNWTSSHLS